MLEDGGIVYLKKSLDKKEMSIIRLPSEEISRNGRREKRRESTGQEKIQKRDYLSHGLRAKVDLRPQGQTSLGRKGHRK